MSQRDREKSIVQWLDNRFGEGGQSSTDQFLIRLQPVQNVFQTHLKASGSGMLQLL